MSWERCSDGRVPRDAVYGGWEAGQGEALFVGRGVHNGNKNPGKVHPSHNVCYIAFGDKEFACRDYEVLVNPGNRVHLEWEHCRDGNVPPNAVEGGQNPEGETYYIGRHSHRGDTLVGKIHTRKRMLYVSYAGGSVTKSEYEVLVRK